MPYSQIKFDENHSGDISNISVELFAGDVALTRVTGRLSVPVIGDLAVSLSSLETLRSAKEVGPVAEIVRAVGGFLKGQARRSDANLVYSTYFTMKVQLPATADEFDASVSKIRTTLTALLIGTKNPELLREGIVDKVWGASEELNAKAVSELLLLNRQGFLYLVPRGPYEGPHLSRFERTRDLAALALYVREFLREGHAFGLADGADADDIVRRMRQWVDHPRTTFDASVSHTWSWITLSTQLLLPERLVAWREYFGKSD